MFEDNPYMVKIKEQLGMTGNVEDKINKMLGKQQTNVEVIPPK